MSVSQILEELDPETENIATAAFSGINEIEYGTVPVLHLPLTATFAAPSRDDFMTTTDKDEASDDIALVSYRSKDQARLAIWAAFARSRTDSLNADSVGHVLSLLSIAEASGHFLDEEVQQFLFVDAVQAIDAFAGDVMPRFLRQICDFTVQYLDHKRKEHVQMVIALANAVERDAKHGVDFHRSMTKLMPFLPEDHTLELVQTITDVIENRETEAAVSFSAAEALSVLIASLDQRSRVWTRLALRLPGLVAAALRAREGDDNSVADRQHLLFGAIQSILQRVQHGIKSSTLEAVAELDLSGLAQAQFTSPAMDGALVAAIHAHRSWRSVCVRSCAVLLSSAASKQQDVVRGLPCTLLTLLSALLEQEAPTLSQQQWTQAHVQPIVLVAASAVLEADEMAVRSRRLPRSSSSVCDAPTSSDGPRSKPTQVASS